MSQHTDSQFGWLKDESTKDLINRKFFAKMSNDLAMVTVISAEIDRRAEDRLAAIIDAQKNQAYL